MAIGKNRSPHQTFGLSDFEPSPSDADLLPKPTVRRPSKERQVFGPNREAPGGTLAGDLKAAGPGPFPDGFLSADDVEALPWTRRRGDEWTTPEFRQIVLDFVGQFFRDREGQGLVGWDITERARAGQGSVRLAAKDHYLRVGISRQIGDEVSRVEAAIAFPPEVRQSPEAEAQLAILAVTLDALLT